MIRRTLLVIAVLAAGFVWSPAAAAPSAPVTPPGFARGGTPPSQVPACTDVTPGKPDDAAPEPEPAFGPEDPRALVCKAEPTQVVSGSAPSHTTNGLNGYHFASVETVPPRNRQGVRSKINSVNPNVAHDCTCDKMFVAEWVMAEDRRPNSGQFIQDGWAENALFGNERHVFSYDTSTNAWFLYDQFPLTDGNGNGRSYTVRHTGTGFGWQWSTYVFSNGAWRLLRSAWLDLPPNDGTVFGENTSMAASLEVFINPAFGAQYHPCVPSHINTNAQMFVEPAPYTGYYDWTYSFNPYSTQAFAPYSISLPYSGTAEVWSTGGGC